MAYAAATTTSIIASITLAAIFYFYVPLSADGAWYSYPAYAWSQGGDPSENLPGVARPFPAPDRETAKFGWENRSNLTVLLTEGWFKIFAPSWVTLKGFGAAQLILLALLIGVAVLRLSRNPMLGLFAGCLVASDARVVAEAMSDARPDLFIAVFAAALLLLLIEVFESLKWGSLVAAAALAVILPLLHVTAANAIAFFFAFLACCTFAARHIVKANRRLQIGLLIAALLVASFFLRQTILDVLIPTKVAASLEDQFRHHLDYEIQTIIAGGARAKVEMELTRWTHYFFRGNFVNLLFMIVALIGGVRVMRGGQYDLSTLIALSLVAGFFAAAFAMLLTDSHDLWPHALVLVALGHVGFVSVLGTATRTSILGKARLAQICCGTLAFGALLNFADAFILYRQYGSVHYSNATEEAFLLNALPQRGDVTIIAPTEIWPYLVKRRQPLLLIDPTPRAVFRHKGYVFDIAKDAEFAGTAYLVLNKEYYIYGWERAAEAWSRRGEFVAVKQLGDCELAVQCLRIYALASGKGPTHRTTSP